MERFQTYEEYQVERICDELAARKRVVNEQIIAEASESYRRLDRRMSQILIWGLCVVMVALCCGAVYVAGKHDVEVWNAPEAVEVQR